MAKRKRAKPEEDTRKIVSGVQLPHTDARTGTVLRTYGPGDEDDLEEVLTPFQLEYLKDQGALDGDWTPAGKEPRPMKGSAVHRGDVSAEDNEAWRQAELEKRQAAKQAAAEEAEAERAEAEGRPHRRHRGEGE